MATAATTTPTPAAPSRRNLIIALVLGAVAAGLIVAFLASGDSNTNTPVGANAATSKVVVATREIPVGTKIEESMVQVKELPQSAIISDPYSTTEEVVGTVARFPLQANEQVAKGRLVDAAKGKSLSFQIPAGLRGFTIQVDSNSSPAALIAPGDFVDVITAAKIVNLLPQTTSSATTASAAQGNDLKAAVTLLQNVQVISVEQTYVSDGVPYDSTVRGTALNKAVQNVTLALLPDQAQLLWLAVQDGKLTLALRGFGDAEVKDVAPIAEPVRVK